MAASLTSIDNNTQDSPTKYFLYDHGSLTTFGEIKKYIQNYGYSIIDSEDLYTQARTDIVSIQNPVGGSVTNIITADTSNNSYKLSSSGTTLPEFGSATAITDSDKSGTNFQYALVIQHTSDYYKLMGRKYDLLKNNTITAYNQETALKYIFVFFLFISLYTFTVSFNKLNLTHIIIYIFFIIYIFYHTSVSNYLLSNFKTTFYELKVAGTATQIITYLKIMFFMLLTLFMPLIVFSSVSNEPFIPFMSATDNLNASETLESVSTAAEESYDTVSDAVKDTKESATTALNDVADSFTEATKGAADGIGESISNTVENIKDSVVPEKKGGSRRMKGGKKK